MTSRDNSHCPVCVSWAGGYYTLFPSTGVFNMYLTAFFCLHCRFVDFGVMLEIKDLQYLPDGRSFLDCVGGRRFKVV